MIKNDKRKIAVVEDNVIYANLIKHALEDNIYCDVLILDYGEKLISQFKSGYKPSLVVLDYDLSGPFAGRSFMNGNSVLDMIKGVDSDIEVIMLSGHDDPEIIGEAITLGAYDYVVKNDSAINNITNRVKNLIKKINLNDEIKAVNRTKYMMIFIAVITVAFSLFINI